MGRFALYLGLLALAAVACVAVARDRSARSIDLEYHFPDRPPGDEVVRGIELALGEWGGRAGPYRVTAVRGKSPRERALRLPGFKPFECVLPDVPPIVPVDSGWGTHGIPPRPDAEVPAILAWMKAMKVVEVLVLHGDFPPAREAGIRVAAYPDDPKPERPSLVMLSSRHDPVRQLRDLRTEGYAGPVLMWSGSVWDQKYREMEGVFVCLAPMNMPSEAFVREHVARYGSRPTGCTIGGYYSCDFALRTLAAQPLLRPDQMGDVRVALNAYNPWREPAGEPAVCEFRRGVFTPWASNR